MSASDASTELAIFCARMSQRTFFVLKSAVNFVAVAVVGIAMWLGVGPHVSLPHAERFDLCDPSPHPQVAL